MTVSNDVEMFLFYFWVWKIPRHSRLFFEVAGVYGPDYMDNFQPRGLTQPCLPGWIFCDYMDDFNPGVETLYYTFSSSIPGSEKSLYFVFL
jgi:hypothetical protein